MADERIIYKYQVKKVKSKKKKPLPTGIQFTKVVSRGIKGDKPESILGYFTLEELVNYTNSLNADASKLKDSFLRGTFVGGSNGSFCKDIGEFFFIDIDVKTPRDKYNSYIKACQEEGKPVTRLVGSFKPDNVHLHEGKSGSSAIKKRQDLEDWLKKNAVFYGFSNSKNGMWACFHVEGMSGFLNPQKRRYQKAGEAVNRFIEETIKKETLSHVKVSLDDAQCKFRQVRATCRQDKPIVINKNYTSFKVKETGKVCKVNGFVDFTFADGEVKPCNGMVEEIAMEHYGRSYIMGKLGFKDEGDGVWSHPSGSTSRCLVEFGEGATVFSNGTLEYLRSIGLTKDSGNYISNVGLVCLATKQTLFQLRVYLRKKGFEDKPIDNEAIYSQIKPDLTDEEIWKLMYTIRERSVREKMEFFEGAVMIPNHKLSQYKAYARLKDLEVHADEVLILKEGEYLESLLPQIYEIQKKHDKICIWGEPNIGKTFSITRSWERLQPNKKGMIVCPYTTIVHQMKDKDEEGSSLNIGKLVGSGIKADDFHNAVKDSSIVACTHIHGAGVLAKYQDIIKMVILDEMHLNLQGMDYRSKELKEFFHRLDATDIKVIGLTATPTPALKSIGYHIIKIKREKKPLKVIQRNDNRNPKSVGLQYLLGEVKEGEKVFMRLNHIEDIGHILDGVIKRELYNRDEIAILTSTKEHKNSETFKLLEKDERFDDKIKLVLCTSVIDAGVNIRNNDFDHFVFIDNTYYPNPSDLKQSISRFRNPNPSMKFVHYRQRVKNDFSKHYQDCFPSIIESLENSVQGLDEWNTMFSDNNKLNADGSKNLTFCAYESNYIFIQSLSSDEYNAFQRINYNLDIKVDEGYEPKKQKFPPKNSKEAKETIYKLFKEDLGRTIAYYCQECNPNVRKQLMNCDVIRYNYNPKGLTPEFIAKNENYRTEIGKRITFLRDIDSLPLDNPTALLFDGKQIENNNNLKIKKEVLRLQGQYLYPDPDNQKSLDVNERLRSIVNAVKSYKGQLTGDELWKMIHKAGFKTYNDRKDFIILKFATFLSIYTDLVYDVDKDVFRLKKEAPSTAVKYIRKWLKFDPFTKEFKDVILEKKRRSRPVGKQLEIELI